MTNTSTSDRAPSPAGSKPRRRGFILASCMLAMFMAAVEVTIVATAMPSIVADLGGFHLFSWVFAGYLLAQSVAVPVYGRLADFYGRKRVFFIGIAIFLTGSALCGVVRSMPLLVACRILQGVGGGSIQTVASTIVGDIYTPAERGKVQAFLSATWTSASLFGPVLGAFIVERLHWSYIFWINLPIGVVTIVMLSVFLDEKVERFRHEIDLLGIALLTLGIGAIMFGLVEASVLSAPALIGTLVGGLILLAAFVGHQRNVSEPTLPFTLWNNRVILIGCIIAFASHAIVMVPIAFMPTYVEAAMGGSPTLAGLMLTSGQVFSLLGVIVSSRIILKTSYRTGVLIGAVALLIGSVVMAAMNPERSILWIATSMAITYIGIAFCNTTGMVSLQTSVGWNERGVVTSMLYFFRLSGMSVGTAIFGGIFNFGMAAYVRDSDALNKLLLPGGTRGIDPAQAQMVQGAIAATLHDIFLFAILFAFAAIAAGYAMPPKLSPIHRQTDGSGASPEVKKG